MNKKITAVTLTALMVLTMFTAMVPAASAAKEVAAPYEFICAVNTTQVGVLSWLNASSKMNPSILYYDLDDNEGKESLTMPIYDNLTVPKGKLIYSTLPWTDDEGNEYIAWAGAKFAVVDTGNDWIISAKLVDEDEDDDHLLRVGESLSLIGGWAISALEIDVDGKKSWLSLTNDGEEVENIVVTEGNDFTYEEDLGASDDTEVMNFTVETVFAGMNTNLVKINNIDLISTDTVEVESGDEDLYNDFEVDADSTQIQIINKDEDITFSEDDITDIMDFAVRVNEDGNLVALAKIITEPGTYELIGAVNGTQTAGLSWLSASSKMNPSILYYDLDDNEGKESLTMPIYDNLTVPKGKLIYSTLPWTDDEGNEYIAWAGAKFAVVDTGNDWIISAKLVDEDEDDDHLLRVGESLSLIGGWAISALEIDVDGKKSWLSLTNDGEEVENIVVTEGNDFTYEEDLGASDDTEVMNFTVETVFAGMNTNLVKINNIDLISTDTVEVESGDEDLYNDFEVDADSTQIQIINKDEDITFSEDDITDIMDFAVRVNEDGNLVALAQEVIVGGPVATPTVTATPTDTVDANVTATPSDVVDANVTATETAPPTEPTPTPEPTDDEVPGFEAVFAIAGLLAVAYLVLRQRE